MTSHIVALSACALAASYQSGLILVGAVQNSPAGDVHGVVLAAIDGKAGQLLALQMAVGGAQQ